MNRKFLLEHFTTKKSYKQIDTILNTVKTTQKSCTIPPQAVGGGGGGEHVDAADKRHGGDPRAAREEGSGGMRREGGKVQGLLPARTRRAEQGGAEEGRGKRLVWLKKN